MDFWTWLDTSLIGLGKLWEWLNTPILYMNGIPLSSATGGNLLAGGFTVTPLMFLSVAGISTLLVLHLVKLVNPLS